MSKKHILLAISALLGFGIMSAQNSAPAPGSGGGFNPNPANGIGWNPGPQGPSSAPAPGSGGVFTPNNGSAWGSPWNGPATPPPPPPSAGASISISGGFISGMNSGVCNVVGVGYDAQGVWRTVPMRVSYNWNGVQYNVNVLGAWNPWTDTWNPDIDNQAFSTSYFLRGQTYNYYAVLPTGTYYFNL